MPPRGCRQRKKASQPQTPLPSIPEADILPAQKQSAEPGYAHVFLHHTVRPVNRFDEPLVPPEMLSDLKITIIPLDFDSGESPNTQIPALIQLSDRKVLHAELERIVPWRSWSDEPIRTAFYYEYEPRRLDREHDHRLEASKLCELVGKHVSYGCGDDSRQTILDRGSWLYSPNETDMGRNSIVPRNGSDYSWSLPNVYYNYEPRPPQTYERFHAKDKPHGICHVVDTTPFDGQRIRTSELKCIAILAFFRNAQPEYRHLDYFCITVMSFWDREVRIVQGLVNFKTNAIELRVSPAQSFDAGIRSSDTQYQKFLTLLAYFGEVHHLTGL